MSTCDFQPFQRTNATHRISDANDSTDAAVIRAGPWVNLSFSGLNKTGAMQWARLSAVDFAEKSDNRRRNLIKSPKQCLLQSTIFARTSLMWDNQTMSLGGTLCNRGAIRDEDSCTVITDIGPKLGTRRITKTDTAIASSGGTGSVGSSTTPLKTLRALSTSGLVAMLTNRAGAFDGFTAETYQCLCYNYNERRGCSTTRTMRIQVLESSRENQELLLPPDLVLVFIPHIKP